MQLNQRGSASKWAQFWSQSSLVQSSLGWRRYAVVLLPLALAGLLPPWALLVMALLFGLAVDWPRWARARLAGLLVLGALLSVSLMLGWKQDVSFSYFFSGLSWTYLKVMAVLVMLHFALLYLEEGNRLGLLFILLAGLLAPQPGLLVALLAGALLRPGRDDMLGQHLPTAQEQGQGKRAWGAVMLVAALVVGAAAWLPRSYPAFLQNSPAVAAQPTSQPVTQLTLTGVRRHLPPLGAAPRPDLRPELNPPSLELLTTTTLLGLALLAWRFLRWARVGRPKPQKWELFDVLLLLGLLLNMVVVAILGLAHDEDVMNRSGSFSTGNLFNKTLDVTVAGRHFALPARAVTAASWLVWLLTIAVILLAVWRLRGLSALTATARTPDAVAAPSALLTQNTLLPTNRVRLAYAQAEEALTRAGYPRQPAETPTLYAARLAQLFPALAGNFSPLTQLYLPVRYGGDIGETAAQQAEQAAAATVQLAAQLPPPSKETETP